MPSCNMQIINWVGVTKNNQNLTIRSVKWRILAENTEASDLKQKLREQWTSEETVELRNEVINKIERFEQHLANVCKEIEVLKLKLDETERKHQERETQLKAHVDRLQTKLAEVEPDGKPYHMN